MKTILIILVLIIVGAAGYFLYQEIMKPDCSVAKFGGGNNSVTICIGKDGASVTNHKW